MSIHTLEPGLLLAAPRLGDPNFEGTVVLLGLHDEEDGSLGWTINGAVVERASTIVRATGLVPLDDELPAGFDLPAVRGGPVSPESVWILYDRRGAEPLHGSILVGDDIGITASADALRVLVAGSGPPTFRLLIGYAGWGAGQLAAEVAAGGWLPAEADADLLFAEETAAGSDRAGVWERAYARVLGTGPGAFVTQSRGSA